MKKVFLMICVLVGFIGYSQSTSGFGVKAGFNFNSNGELRDVQNINADSQIGFHIGIFGKVEDGQAIFFKPELVFTKTNSDYDGDKFEMSKLDAPLLVGLNIVGPLHVFAGPSLQYILDTELEGVTLNDVENDFTVGLNMGVGLNLGERAAVDLRWERGFSDNEAEFVGLSPEGGRIDTRPSQLILSLSVQL
ncbi:outer membrane beta-barrel protein [Galbibacter sp. EGI 63066]|uniref:outer membrane beta-barrel protein n=1 Tax=Galbibacter sp. EGI 63066 TaxID=2993559 RepID=UPI0022496929|nr:outer membrane beta-barrel protein [Galbibacter sp. EGI 63066]MCX2680724.1 outer membrane beta-barrel protein [Galbibacter sp. EGI 63066]